MTINELKANKWIHLKGFRANTAEWALLLLFALLLILGIQYLRNTLTPASPTPAVQAPAHPPAR